VKLDGRQVKFLILGLGILLSMTYLIVVGMNRPGGAVYYLTVPEFLAQPDPTAGDYRVNGKVVTGSIERLDTGMDALFTVVDPDSGSTIPVTYHGVIPDTFVDDAAVVVEGRLQSDGSFTAHTLLAKCPSKYESADDAPNLLPLEAAQQS